MVKDHSERERERGPTAATTWATLSDYQQGFFYMHYTHAHIHTHTHTHTHTHLPTDRIAHATAFVITVMEYWLEREIVQWVHHEREMKVIFV